MDVAGGYILGFGECYGNPRFCEGYYVHTSPVLNIEMEGQNLKFFTRSGSCYAAALEDVAEQVLERTQKVIRMMGIQLDADQCRMLKQQRIEAVKRYVSEIIHSNELYVKMAGAWDVKEAFFKKEDGSVVDIAVVRHDSSFSEDSILVTDWKNGLCDWRIFPSFNSIKPYCWSEGLCSVKIENVGNDFVFRGSHGDILCEHGKITTVKEDELHELLYW